MPERNHKEITTYINININTCENTEVWVLEVGDIGPGGPLIFIIIIFEGPYFRIEIINTYLNLTICGDSCNFPTWRIESGADPPDSGGPKCPLVVVCHNNFSIMHVGT